MIRPSVPVLTLVCVPMLAMAFRTREPKGPLRCPGEATVASLHRPARTAELPKAEEGEPISAGLQLAADDYLHVTVPPHQGWVWIDLRADGLHPYVLEVERGGHWVEVGRFPHSSPGALRNRRPIEVEVGEATLVSIAPSGDAPGAAISMVCVQGTRWQTPVWIPIAFLVGLVFVVLRSIPSVEDLLAEWVRADLYVALALGVGLLETPLLLLTLLPVMLVMHLRRRPPDEAE